MLKYTYTSELMQPWTGIENVLYVGAVPRHRKLPSCYEHLKSSYKNIDCLEAFPRYAANLRKKNWFRIVFEGEIQHYHLKYYDVIFWWHGPEHLLYEDACKTLLRLRKLAKYVVIGCPIGHTKQGIVDNNAYQEHRCGFAAQDFIDMGYKAVAIGKQRKRGSGIIAWSINE